MVGLSVVLEAQTSYDDDDNRSSTVVAGGGRGKKTLVINKATTMVVRPPRVQCCYEQSHHHQVYSNSPPPPPSSGGGGFMAAGEDFLNSCHLCKEKLSPGKDIYMYKGDSAFCSEECRWKQMVRDEEMERVNQSTYYYSAAAASSTPSYHRSRRCSVKYQPAGGFSHTN